jgi:hypothetical protein
MSYFEDQEEAWFANDCKGNIEDYNPFDADSWPQGKPPSNRTRNLLALSKLGEFSKWAVSQGYLREPMKGTYEVLRLRKKNESPVLYFKRNSGEHATSYGNGTALVQQWINSRKVKKEVAK